MSVNLDHPSHAGSASTGLKIFVLALFAIVTSIIAVSFAAHHMRIGFENEYADQAKKNTVYLAATCSLAINGDDILTDPTLVGSKYESVLKALIVDTEDVNQNRKFFGLYSYANGSLNPLVLKNAPELLAVKTKVSEWLTVEAKPYIIEKPGQTTILTPIKNSQGVIVGVFELSETYSFLETYGNTVEQRVLMSGIVSVFAGIILFSLQYVLPEIFRFVRSRGGND
jgi:hypothetical protein